MDTVVLSYEDIVPYIFLHNGVLELSPSLEGMKL